MACLTRDDFLRRRGLITLVSALRSFAGAVFVFRNRRSTAIKVLVYDGQGFWLCHKRLSEGRFRWWPSLPNQDAKAKALAAHQLSVLFSAGNPDRTAAAPDWRAVGPRS